MSFAEFGHMAGRKLALEALSKFVFVFRITINSASPILFCDRLRPITGVSV